MSRFTLIINLVLIWFLFSSRSFFLYRHQYVNKSSLLLAKLGDSSLWNKKRKSTPSLCFFLGWKYLVIQQLSNFESLNFLVQGQLFCYSNCLLTNPSVTFFFLLLKYKIFWCAWLKAKFYTTIWAVIFSSIRNLNTAF